MCGVHAVPHPAFASLHYLMSLMAVSKISVFIVKIWFLRQSQEEEWEHHRPELLSLRIRTYVVLFYQRVSVVPPDLSKLFWCILCWSKLEWVFKMKADLKKTRK